MEDQWRVVLVGDSVFQDAVTTSLRGVKSLRLEMLGSDSPDLAEQLNRLRPDAVIFDLYAPHVDFVLPFLRTRPNHLVIGVDLKNSKVNVLSCQQFAVMLGSDLANLVQKNIFPHPARPLALKTPAWSNV